MSLVATSADIKADQVKRQTREGTSGRTETIYFRATRDTPYGPTAFLNRYDPGRLSSAHFHSVDQFQIIIDGHGKFAHHDVAPYWVHFARAWTPYGPLQADKDIGWTFMTLRTRYDPGSRRLPACQDELKQVPNRRPWQVTKMVTFPNQSSGVTLQDVPEIKDDQGLFTCALTMAAHTHIAAPEPCSGDGQFVMIVKGSFMHANQEHQALTVVFIKPEENAFEIRAGAQGLQGFIFNFPKVKPRPARVSTPSTVAGFKKWQCTLCSFTYDEALGLPAEGIPAGTTWADVPDTWSCPDCSASKSDFQMVEI